MRVSIKVIAVILSFLVAACNSSRGPDQIKRNGARPTIDGVHINWGVATALGKHSSGADLAIFAFTRELNGQIAGAGLSIAQRAALGKRALEAHPSCSWVGFDDAVNTIQSYRLGAVDSIIVAPVNC